METRPLIYAHRGMWHPKGMQNSARSLEAVKAFGYGAEIDFRSSSGKLVISHDPYTESNYTALEEVDLIDIPLAMNIKEDGLLSLYSDFLKKNQNKYTFLFDGSIPEMYKIRKLGLPHALRLSEFEQDLPWETRFVWVDGFISDWWINSEWIETLIETHFLVFVSPELHAREFKDAWNFFSKIKRNTDYQFGICTDFPRQLQDSLNE